MNIPPSRRSPLARRGTISAAALIALAALSVWWKRPDRPSRNTVEAAGASSVFSDYRSESPGHSHRIELRDLPAPYATASADAAAEPVRRPAKAWPQAPAGFVVGLYAAGLENPRLMRTAPNGDVFVAESEPGKILVLRGIDSQGRAQRVETFATGLNKPFGIAFYPPGSQPEWVYIANTDSVVRFAYGNGDLKARGPAQKLCELPGGGLLRGGGHWTRDVAFSNDGKTMFVSVGSRSNDDDPDTHPAEHDRADVLQFNPDGSGQKIYAWGIRNPVGIAVHPKSGELWVSVNERDDLGDNLPPDYITHVTPGGFYGWPWYYMGGTQDPRQHGKHPELRDRVITPDVLIQPHNASLEMLFYQQRPNQTQLFPQSYWGDIFAAEHGSWNRAVRTGYEVIRVPMHGGSHAENRYEDFLTGFVTADGRVWGRPVGVAEAADGSLLVSDDVGEAIWRVSRPGGGARR
jgi:glucose/arabinose dehydrogenase